MPWSSRRPTPRTCRWRRRPRRPASTSTSRSRWRSSVAECDAILAAARRRRACALTVASQARYNEISIRAKELIEDGTVGPITMFRVTSPTVGWDVPADGWFVDPEEGGAYLDWGPHGCDTLRWFTGADATARLRACSRNFGGHPRGRPERHGQLPPGIGRHGPVLDELRDPGARAGLLHAVAVRGRATGCSTSPATCSRSAAGDAWRIDLELPAWDWLVDPKAPRRIGMTARQVEQFARRDAGRHAPRHHRRGRPRGDRDVEAAIRSARTGRPSRSPWSRGMTAAPDPDGWGDLRDRPRRRAPPRP